VAVDNLPSVIGHIRDGRLRALAGDDRDALPRLPDVPTTAEAGFPEVEATAWFGVQAPARTPRPIIERLGAEIDAVTKEPETRAKMAELGGMPPGLTPDGGTSPETFEAVRPGRDRQVDRGGAPLRRHGGVGDMAALSRRAACSGPLALPPSGLHSAQDAWPSRPIRLVIPFTPAGTTDLVGRLAAERFPRGLGQQVVVENRPGAGGNVGAEFVARARRTGTRCCSPPSAPAPSTSPSTATRCRTSLGPRRGRACS
jgi:tripartite-type tricarboxylate transporter receptor subunit TctC